MKKYLIIISLSLIFFTINSFAQWQTDERLTFFAPPPYATSLNNEWCVAANGNNVHVVCYDRISWEIYYIRSTDGGISWNTDTALTNNGIYNVYSQPSISAFGSYVHIAFNRQYTLSQYPQISYKRSTDGGLSWQGEVFITSYDGSSYYPSISVSDPAVYIVWETMGGPTSQIQYSSSLNEGSTWSGHTNLSNSTSNEYTPSVSSTGAYVHVVWDDTRDGIPELYYKGSTNEGSTWGADTRLTTNPPAHPEIPSIASNGQLVHVVWDDNRDGNYEIYYKRSTNNGVSWGPDTRLTNNPADSRGPSIASSGTNLHIVWADNRDGNYEIYYKHSYDGGVTWGADTRLTFNDSTSSSPSIAVSGPDVHVAWSDSRTGNYNVFYKRNPTGNLTGIININSDIPKVFSLSQNYPNPFNPSTKIRFSIPALSSSERVEVRLVIYDILGREITTLVNEQLKPGTYEVDWNASNFPSGVYFYTLTTKDFRQTKRMVFIK